MLQVNVISESYTLANLGVTIDIYHGVAMPGLCDGNNFFVVSVG
jgi:hypothetical protein